jgi:cell division protein FtsI/penicillin-binding protein 2
LVKSLRRRLSGFFILLILLPTLVLILRLFSLQFLPQDRIEDILNKISGKKKILEEVRGEIYDRKGRELAISVERRSLCVYPDLVHSKEPIAREVSRILGIPRREILRRLSTNRKFNWIKRKITPSEEKEIERLGIEGLGFVKEYKRFYPKGRLAGHLMGFVGVDNYGLEGIEAYFDSYLKGDKRRVRVIKDGYGKTVLEEDPHDLKGHSIVLTIDEAIQHIAEVELERVVKESRAKGGVVIVMYPSSGEILAMAVQPNFDPNRFTKSKSHMWRNRAITDPIEPGSTFKVFAYAAALEEESVDLGKRLYCPGYTMVANHRIDCWKNHKRIDFRESLIQSCNTGAVEVILGLSPRGFFEYMRRFGFGTITGIHLPGERKGCLKRPFEWSGLSQVSIGIGQEILVTPLQLATAFSCLANEGRLMRPLIVREIIDRNKAIIRRFRPRFVRQVVSEETCSRLKELLAGVVLHGTGERANIEGYRIYGKTGTAQKYDPSIKRFSNERFISLFVGWVESGKKKVVIQVIIDEPQGPHLGGEVAAPLFKEIALKILPYLGLSPEGERIPKVVLAKESIPKTDPGLIPDVRGMTMRAAYRMLSQYDVDLVFTGSGIATIQSPSPLTRARGGMKVHIHFEPKI